MVGNEGVWFIVGVVVTRWWGIGRGIHATLSTTAAHGGDGVASGRNGSVSPAPDVVVATTTSAIRVRDSVSLASAVAATAALPVP